MKIEKTKNLFLFGHTVLLLFFLLKINKASAGGAAGSCDSSAWFFCNPLRGSVETLEQAGEQLLGYILGLIGPIALLLIIIAGIMYMTSAGNEERIGSSKKILSGAIIGLAIALMAYGLLQVIIVVLNG